MKKLFAIIFAFTMLLQAIPLLHFFSACPQTFYVAMDEEKTGDKNKEVKEDKADEKSLFFGQAHYSTSFLLSSCFTHFNLIILPSPHIEMPLLPPNFC